MFRRPPKPPTAAQATEQQTEKSSKKPTLAQLPKPPLPNLRPKQEAQAALPIDVAELQAQIEALKKERDTYLDLTFQLQTIIGSIETSLIELQEIVPHLQKPTIQALINLKLKNMSVLPIALQENAAKAEKMFEKHTGHPTSHFLNPVKTITELLGYRVHTVIKLLTQMVSGENIGVGDVKFQSQNDMNVLINHEKERRKHKQFEQERTKA